MPKGEVRSINCSKNKLNSKIIFIFHSNPNASLLQLTEKKVIGLNENN